MMVHLLTALCEPRCKITKKFWIRDHILTDINSYIVISLFFINFAVVKAIMNSIVIHGCNGYRYLL